MCDDECAGGLLIFFMLVVMSIGFYYYYITSDDYQIRQRKIKLGYLDAWSWERTTKDIKEFFCGHFDQSWVVTGYHSKDYKGYINHHFSQHDWLMPDLALLPHGTEMGIYHITHARLRQAAHEEEHLRFGHKNNNNEGLLGHLTTQGEPVHKNYDISKDKHRKKLIGDVSANLGIQEHNHHEHVIEKTKDTHGHHPHGGDTDTSGAGAHRQVVFNHPDVLPSYTNAPAYESDSDLPSKAPASVAKPDANSKTLQEGSSEPMREGSGVPKSKGAGLQSLKANASQASIALDLAGVSHDQNHASPRETAL